MLIKGLIIEKKMKKFGPLITRFNGDLKIKKIRVNSCNSWANSKEE